MMSEVNPREQKILEVTELVLTSFGKPKPWHDKEKLTDLCETYISAFKEIHSLFLED